MKNRQEILLPSMGESIIEATLLNYTKQIGDRVEEDETIAEVATDKVDSEVPSPFSGIITDLPFQKDDVIQIGQVIAVISTKEGSEEELIIDKAVLPAVATNNQVVPEKSLSTLVVDKKNMATTTTAVLSSSTIYTPLVKTICKKEGIDLKELASVQGTGKNGKITKKDVLKYIATGKQPVEKIIAIKEPKASPILPKQPISTPTIAPPIQSNNHQIVEMDRMRKMIANHMVLSKKTSPHVSTFLEVDVTNIVQWRNKNKQAFLTTYEEKLTYTPIFFEAIAKAIKDFPNMNASTSEDIIYIKKDINLGMAAALPSGNLIVPVIKKADRLNLVGLAAEVNRLAKAARENRLNPSDVKDGTFTISNIGTFGNDAGTPIINQPQAAILALGAINKKPAVVTTDIGDVIAIRHRMILSISFDHRIIDGFLGGSFLRRVGDYLETFDEKDII